MSRVIVVIPTYNEIENLPLLAPKVLAQDPRIELLIVDDASPDGTGKLADDLARQSPRVHVLHREAKQGLGPAYRAGLRRALELGADFIVQMDADFSHPPETLAALLAEIEHHDVVLGSRYLNGITVVNWPIERILISWFGNWYARKVTGLPISDTTGGFRCIRRELLETRRLRAHPLERLCLPDRAQLPLHEARRAREGDPVLLPRPHARHLEAHAADRPRSPLDRLVAAHRGRAAPPLTGCRLPAAS